MEHKFSTKRLLSLFVVLAMLFTSFAFVLPASAEVEILNLTQGKEYTTTKASDGTYADESGKDLTDGVVVTHEDCTGYGDSRWVGFNVRGIREFDFNIEFGKVYDLSKVEINVGGTGCGAGVTEPYFTVYYTTDGSNWTEFGKYTESGDSSIKAFNITLEKDTPVKASALKVTFGITNSAKNLLWVGEVAAYGAELPEDEHICVGVGEWQKDETNHWKVCDCGELTDVAAHDEGRWVVTTPAVPGTDGLKELQCTVCGYAFDSEVIEAPIAIESFEATVHGTYTASLIDGVKATSLSYNDENWFAFYNNGNNPSNAPDMIGTVILTLGAKYDLSEVKVHIYDNAGSSGIYAPASVNVYLSNDGETWGDAIALVVPTNESGTACYVEGEVIGTAEYVKVEFALAGTFCFLNEIEVYGVETPAHECVAGEDWLSDENGHWNECECGEKMNEAAHDEGEWVETKPAEIGVEGEKELQCTVCGYVLDTDVIEALPEPHECVAGEDWLSDENGHWNECECGEKMNEAAHDEGEWVETKPAEIGVEGEKELQCTVCGYVLDTDVIEALPEPTPDPEPETLINITAGKEYTTTKASDGTYADESGKDLTDGVVVTHEDCTGYGDSRWVGFNVGGIREFDFNIEFGKVYDLSKVEINVGGTGCGAGVTEPYFTVYYTTDGSNWTEFGKYTESGDSSIKAFNITLEKDTPVKASALKVTFGLTNKNLLWVGEVAAYGAELPEGEHICVGVGEWQKDETNHWKVCECEELTDLGAHDEGRWVVATPAVPGTDGTRELQCTVCGYALDSEVIVAPIKAESYEAIINGTYTANLNDGIKSTILTYNDSNWFAFNASNTTDGIATVVFNLGKAYDLSEVKIHIYDHLGGSGISAPVSANVYLSDDGETWGEAIALVIPTNTSSTACYVEGPVTGTAKFVKVELERNGNHFVFLNEIEVYGSAHENCEAGEDWFSDENGHWNECACGSKHNEAAHDDGEWVETKPAEVGVEGEKELRCTVCGYVLDTDVIEALPEPTPDPEPVLPPEDATKNFTILTNGGFALSDFTIFVRLGELTTIGEVAGALRGIEADSADADYNYYALILVDADGVVTETNFTLGRPDGAKNEVVIPEGGYALLMHADNVDFGTFASVAVGDTFVLTNVDLEALAEATEASELTDAYASLYKAPEPPLVDGELADIDSYTVSDTAQWSNSSWDGVKPEDAVGYDDGVKLIDGVKGTNGLTPALDGWYFGSAYADGGNVEINLTLTNITELTDIAAYFYHYYPTGYSSATEMQIFVSLDGETYVPVTVATVKTALNELDYPNFALTVAFDEAVLAKYVRVILVAPANSLVLIDEIEVYGSAHENCEAGEDWFSDENGHWNECTCGSKHNEAAHDDGEWVETKPAEVGVEGEKELRCTVCGYVLDTDVIEALPHPDAEVADLTGDGQIDSADYLLLKRACYGSYELTEEQAVIADFDGDGEISSADYVILKRIAFGTLTLIPSDELK